MYSFVKKYLPTLFSFSAWLFSLWFTWLLLSQQNFLYGIWYELLDIQATIHTYAPENRFGKSNFYQTEHEEHQRLFAQIVASINNNGEGLSGIHYYVAEQKYSMLTKDEIVHLQDVAHLVAGLHWLGMFALAIIMVAGILTTRKKLPLTPLKKQLYTQLIIIISLLIALLLSGAERVFYALHEWIFPHDHQWFFYYQDSLMSMIMQAPVIFAPIAITWLLLTWLCWLLIIVLCHRLTDKKNPTGVGI